MTPARAHRRRTLARLTTAALAVVVLGGAGAVGVATVLDRAEGRPQAVRCSAHLDGTSWHLAPDQAETAALLVGTSVRRGMPARAATIAIATGLQESKLRNIDYGDRDSVGIFQQRPSQGWGSVEEILDPVYATNAFYDALEQVDGYVDLEITVAAQAVQRSAFPDAYAQHEHRARAWASALTGHSPASVTCDLPRARASDASGLLERLERDLGVSGSYAEGTVTVDASAVAGPADAVTRKAWVVGHWAVAVAEPFGVERVQVGAAVWERGGEGWAEATAPLADGQVAVTLAGPHG